MALLQIPSKLFTYRKTIKLTIMTNDEKMQNLFQTEKKKYVSPEIDVIKIQMESGIAAASASVTPVTVNGAADQVVTDWEGTDDTTITTGF